MMTEEIHRQHLLFSKLENTFAEVQELHRRIRNLQFVINENPELRGRKPQYHYQTIPVALNAMAENLINIGNELVTMIDKKFEAEAGAASDKAEEVEDTVPV